MPQMAPTMWTHMSFMTTTCLLMFMILLFFLVPNKHQNTSMKTKTTFNNNWKW